jgi:hypothetical protein
MFDHKGMTAMEARRRSQPGESKAPGDKTRPMDQEQGGEGGEGDGNHHHEIHEREDGSAHSVHIHPDGHKEEMDHGSYEEAVQHENEVRGTDEEDQDNDNRGHDEPDGDEPEDLAGMYESD